MNTWIFSDTVLNMSQVFALACFHSSATLAINFSAKTIYFIYTEIFESLSFVIQISLNVTEIPRALNSFPKPFIYWIKVENKNLLTTFLFRKGEFNNY